MNFLKYKFLYDFIPSLKDVIESKKLSFSQRRSLKIISKYYKSNSLKDFNKNILRKKIKLQKANISIAKLKKKSLYLNKKVLNSCEFKAARSVFCYISFGDEIDTFKILESCLKNSKILSVPVIKAKRIIEAAIINNLDNLVKNKYGILEPVSYRAMDKKDIDLVIVPAMGYNTLGYRIGYGGGYYDFFLKDFNGFSIGMVLKEFLIPGLIPGYFDIPVKKLFIL